MQHDWNKVIDIETNLKEVHLYPIFDVHYGSITHNEDAFRQMLKRIKEDENAMVILGGDLISNNTRSSIGSPWDDVKSPREQKAEMVEALKDIKDKVICSVQGNHEYRTTKDSFQDLSFDMMSKLDLEDYYRQDLALLRIKMGKRPNGKDIHGEARDRCCEMYKIAVCHGAGGGMYVGSSVNKVERMGLIISPLDLMLMGHVHKGAVTKAERIHLPDKGDSYKLPYSSVIVESWQEYGGYAARKMLQPAETCRPQVITLRSDEHRVEVKW